MSKHIFETVYKGEPHNIQIGWDKPMRSFYYVVSPYTEFEGESMLDDPIFSNLDHGEAIDIAVVVAKFKQLSIKIPAGLIASVKIDELNNVVNEVKKY